MGTDVFALTAFDDGAGAPPPKGVSHCCSSGSGLPWPAALWGQAALEAAPHRSGRGDLMRRIGRSWFNLPDDS